MRNSFIHLLGELNALNQLYLSIILRRMFSQFLIAFNHNPQYKDEILERDIYFIRNYNVQILKY